MRRLVLPSSGEGSMRFKQWLSDQHGEDSTLWPDNAYGFGLEKDGEIIGACVLQSFHAHGDYLASIFSNDPRVFFSKGLVKKVLMVPFSEPFNANRLTLIINCKDHRTVEFALRHGFRGEGILLKHFGDEDATILGLLRSQIMEA